jgi:hypothetical protein
MLDPGTELLRTAADDEGEPDITLEEGHVFLNDDPPPEAPPVAVDGPSRLPGASLAPDLEPTSPAAPVAPASARAAGKRPARQLVLAGEPLQARRFSSSLSVRSAAYAQPAGRAMPAGAKTRCASTAPRSVTGPKRRRAGPPARSWAAPRSLPRPVHGATFQGQRWL